MASFWKAFKTFFAGLAVVCGFEAGLEEAAVEEARLQGVSFEEAVIEEAGLEEAGDWPRRSWPRGGWPCARRFRDTRVRDTGGVLKHHAFEHYGTFRMPLNEKIGGNSTPIGERPARTIHNPDCPKPYSQDSRLAAGTFENPFRTLK